MLVPPNLCVLLFSLLLLHCSLFLHNSDSELTRGPLPTLWNTFLSTIFRNVILWCCLFICFIQCPCCWCVIFCSYGVQVFVLWSIVYCCHCPVIILIFVFLSPAVLFADGPKCLDNLVLLHCTLGWVIDCYNITYIYHCTESFIKNMRRK